MKPIVARSAVPYPPAMAVRDLPLWVGRRLLLRRSKAVADQWPKARKMIVLERMRIIQRIEESLVHLFEQKDLHGHYHLAYRPGRDRPSETLRPGDQLVTTHRNHGQLFGRSADPSRAPAPPSRVSPIVNASNRYILAFSNQ
jgi:hypothetical protein